MRHLPNVLTISRIIITPLMLVLLMTGTFVGRLSALVLFVYAAISDYYDGKIARSWDVKSRLGQYLDPLADKILVLGTFVALAFLVPSIVTWWGVVLIALRDFMVTGLRTWAESRGRSIRTLGIAKAKTTVQLVFLIGMLVILTADRIRGPIGRFAEWLLASPILFILFLGVVAFTVYTGAIYMMRQEYSTPIDPNA